MELTKDCITNNELFTDETHENNRDSLLINYDTTYLCDRRRKLNKRERYEKEQRHLRKLANETKDYPQSVMYVEKKWSRKIGYYDLSKPYYKRVYRGKASSYAKRQSNKKIRRYKGDLHNGYQHIHKIYDVWWEIY